MSFDTIEQERIHANALISEYITLENEFIIDITTQLKESKKKLRKFAKQIQCDHEFKMNININHNVDEYKCKKCKFYFEISLT